MSLFDHVARVRLQLEAHGRVSLRAISRECEVDADGLEEIVEELVDIQGVAERSEKALTWIGAPRPTPPQEAVASPAPTARRVVDYTPKHLSEKILQSRAALEGERKQVTVLFCDIKGSMALAGQLDAEDWHATLDGFFAVLTEGVHRFEGTVNQYTGDGIMALFGAPIAHEDHAQRACYAALQLRDSLRRYAVDLRMTRGLDFGVRIGLNSGAVVVGRIGDDLRMDYTAQGHTVGLAQRLEQLCETGHVYLSEHTARLVGGYFELSDLGRHRLRGEDGDIGVFDLQGTTAARTRLDVSRSRGLTQFVGRDTEMALLEGALARAKNGHGQVVGVVGEPGLGKSRLCYEFVERCRAAGIAVYEGHCPAHGTTIPFLPILELFRNYFGITALDSTAQARQKVAGALTLIDPGLAEALPVFFDFLGLTVPGERPPTLDADARQRQLFDVTRRITRIQHERGVAIVILIDDLHWIDSWSDAYVAQLVEAAQTSHSLIVVNFRPEYAAAWTSKPYYQQLPLVPLGAEAIAELVRSLLGNDLSLGALAEHILRWTGGNPLYTEEVINTLIETGRLEGLRGAYRLTCAIEALEVPPTVQALIAARIDRLEEDAKHLLQHASVIGKAFSRPLLEAIIDLEPARIAAAVERLKNGDFVYETALYPTIEYTFKHPLIHEVAYDTLLKEQRRTAHASAAAALERLNPERLDELASMIAYHWDLGEVPAQAFEWHRRAAAHAELNDPRTAAKHWLRVRALLEHCEPTPGNLAVGAQACGRLNTTGWRIGASAADARRWFDDGKALAERIGDRRLQSMLVAGYAIHRGINEGDANDYVGLGAQAVGIADTTDDEELQCAVRVMYAAGATFNGQLDEAMRCCEETLPRFPPGITYGSQYIGFPARIGMAVTLGFAYACAGDLPRARALATEGRERNMGNLDIRIAALGFEAYGLGLYGWADEAIRLGEQAWSEGEAGASNYMRVIAMLGLTAGLMSGGRLDEADLLATRAIELIEREYAGRAHLPSFQGIKAGIRLVRGAAESVAEDAREGIAFCREHGIYYDLTLWQVLAEACTQFGDCDGALAALSDMETQITRSGTRLFSPFLHERRADFATRFGERWNARDELEAAHRLFLDLGADPHATRIAARLGELA